MVYPRYIDSILQVLGSLSPAGQVRDTHSAVLIKDPGQGHNFVAIQLFLFHDPIIFERATRGTLQSEFKWLCLYNAKNKLQEGA